MIQGCTYQAWYEGLREQQRQECHKYISDDVVQRCLENIENGIKRNEELKKTASGEKLALAEEKITFLKSKKEEISAL